MIFVGSAFLATWFVIFELNAGYGAFYRIGIRFWLVVMALATLLISFMVRTTSQRRAA